MTTVQVGAFDAIRKKANCDTIEAHLRSPIRSEHPRFVSVAVSIWRAKGLNLIDEINYDRSTKFDSRTSIHASNSCKVKATEAIADMAVMHVKRVVGRGYCAVKPPSATIACPVTKLALSEHNQIATSAISEGSATRPSGA